MGRLLLIILVALFGLSTLCLSALVIQMRQDKVELEETIDYLVQHNNENIVVIDENIKSKQERTRIKIEDIIITNRYPSLSQYDLDNLSRIVVKYSERYSVPINLILSVITAESAFNPRAVSWVGALGAMQVMPTTIAGIAVELRVSEFDPFNWDDNIRFGTYYLKKTIKAFDGDIELAVRAYNAGITNISKNIYPEETIGYHKKVMSVYNWLETRRQSCNTFD